MISRSEFQAWMDKFMNESDKSDQNLMIFHTDEGYLAFEKAAMEFSMDAPNPFKATPESEKEFLFGKRQAGPGRPMKYSGGITGAIQSILGMPVRVAAPGIAEIIKEG